MPVAIILLPVRMWGRSVDIGVNPSLVGALVVAVAVGLVGAGFMVQLQLGSHMFCTVAKLVDPGFSGVHLFIDAKFIFCAIFKRSLLAFGFPLSSVNKVGLNR
jgi:hypothetical protein